MKGSITVDLLEKGAIINITSYTHLKKNEELYIELPWPENPASTARDIRNHWTAVSTLLSLISSDLTRWRSNQLLQDAELKLYLWATGPHRTQMMSSVRG